MEDPYRQAPPTAWSLTQTLQELPSRLTPESPTGARAGHLLPGMLTGDHNFRFDFKLDGGDFFQTGVLVASAHTKRHGMPVPLRCKWLRRLGDMLVEIPSVRTNMYQISADDIGAAIVVEASPADGDDGLTGVARGELGPFELDPGTRRRLDDALGAGVGRFSAFDASDVASNGSDCKPSEVLIEAFPGHLRVCQSSAEGSGKPLLADYSLDMPKVILHPLFVTRLQVVTKERTFELEASSRTARDLIAVTIRCFHALKFLPHLQVLGKILRSEDVSQSQSPKDAAVPIQALYEVEELAEVERERRNLDACIDLERIMSILAKDSIDKETLDKVARNLRMEKSALSTQLVDSISGFTEVMQNLLPQTEKGAKPSAAAEESVRRLQDQLRDSMDEQVSLEAEIARLKRELMFFRSERETAEAKSNGAAQATKQEVEELRHEHSLMQAREQQLKVIAEKREKPDQDHMKQLRQYRRDIEELNDDRDTYRRRLEDGEKERHELQENFLFVKSQLEKVQAKQSHAVSTGLTDGSAQLLRIQESTAGVNQEKQVFSSRLEQALRIAERGKAYHEQRLDRATSEGSRLSEERDRAECEMQRISRLYSDTVKDLAQRENSEVLPAFTDNEAPETSDTTRAAQESEAEQLRASISEVDFEIGQREQEHEALKTRMRKLATMTAS